MSATDELRRLLRERGVSYLAREENSTIYYSDGGCRYTYNVNPDSGFAQLYGYHLTPEQVIAATLGSGWLQIANGKPINTCCKCGTLLSDELYCTMCAELATRGECEATMHLLEPECEDGATRMNGLEICPCCGMEPVECKQSYGNRLWVIVCPGCGLEKRGFNRQMVRDGWNNRVPYEDEWEMEGGRITAIVKGGTRFVREGQPPACDRQRIDAMQSVLVGMAKANRKLRAEIDRDRCVGGPGTMVRADAVMAWLDSIIDLDAIRDLGIELEGGSHEAEV